MKRDINLFTAYKNGSAKIGGKSNTGIILLVSAFVIIVAGTYATLLLLQINMDNETKRIKSELSASEIVKNQTTLSALAKKASLLELYYNALDQSGKNYDDSYLITKPILDEILTSMPSSVSITSMKLSPQGVHLICFGTASLDAAAFAQSLQKSATFSLVTYDGIVKEADNKYTFNISLEFKETQK